VIAHEAGGAAGGHSSVIESGRFDSGEAFYLEAVAILTGLSERVIMKRIKILTLVLSIYFVLGAWAQAPTKHTVIKFDVPGAGMGAGQGTLGQEIVDDGAVVGFYIDSGGVTHGFLRSPSGEITKFDPRGSVGTTPDGINSTHSIVGYYLDSNGVYNGFTRSPSGEIKTLNAPEAGKAQGQGTFLGDINDRGKIVGSYSDSNGVSVGFVISPTGKFTKFKAPGVGDSAGQGTGVAVFDGLTDAGAIAVYGTDSNNVTHGYLRTRGGKFTEFDPTGSVGTYVTGINANGKIVGIYYDSNGGVHGFVRDADGAITEVNVANAIFTGLYNINASGASVGEYIDPNSDGRGFVLAHDGGITTFSVPGASKGTLAVGNNAAGWITGYWLDSGGVNHGFVRK
jgi:hypothetical protein